MTSAVRALRGATTIESDTTDQIRTRTIELLEQMLERNGVNH
ncbi:MAG: chorismate mutase, partial [Acidimicrobiia bacterium]|nr:chorismate mutase [Acidimicrobiia bacterium]